MSLNCENRCGTYEGQEVLSEKTHQCIRTDRGGLKVPASQQIWLNAVYVRRWNLEYPCLDHPVDKVADNGFGGMG